MSRQYPALLLHIKWHVHVLRLENGLSRNHIYFISYVISCRLHAFVNEVSHRKPNFENDSRQNIGMLSYKQTQLGSNLIVNDLAPTSWQLQVTLVLTPLKH